MKLRLLAFLTCMTFAFVSYGQASFGVGAAYLDDFGVQARAELDVSSLSIIPKATYYFTDGFTALEFNVDAKFDLVTLAEEYPIYGFAGPSLYRVSSEGFSNSEIGLSVGAGTKVNNIYGELRMAFLFCDSCGSELGFNVGYMF